MLLVWMWEYLPATFCNTAEWSDDGTECHVDALTTELRALCDASVWVHRFSKDTHHELSTIVCQIPVPCSP